MVNKVNKKLFLGILLTFIICIGSAILATYSTGPYGNYPNPGHHPGEIGPGTFNASGISIPNWSFPDSTGNRLSGVEIINGEGQFYKGLQIEDYVGAPIDFLVRGDTQLGDDSSDRTTVKGDLNVSGNTNLKATAIDGDLNMNSNKITNLLTPMANSDAATKGYVDAASGNGGDYFVSLNCEGKKTCGWNNKINPWDAPVSNCPTGCTEVYYMSGTNHDDSIIGTDYQRFGNIIVHKQNTFVINQDSSGCSASMTISAWDATSGTEFKKSYSSGSTGCLYCAVSCSIRVCSCS